MMPNQHLLSASFDGFSVSRSQGGLVAHHGLGTAVLQMNGLIYLVFTRGLVSDHRN